MRTVLFLTLSIAYYGASAQQNEFRWLIGTWKMEDKNIFESWELSNDKQTLRGSSFKMAGATAIVLEQTSIIRNGTGFYYIADVAGQQEPVHFHISSFDSSSFVAENPDHDFPKVIRYKLVMKRDVAFLEAVIEGDGRVIPYSFVKLR